MGELHVNPDGVHGLGRVWTQAGESLHQQVTRIRAGRLDPAHFGAHYAGQVGGITAAFDRLEGTWSGWGGHCERYSSNLHSAANAFHAADQADRDH